MNQYDPMTSGHYGEEEAESRVPRSRRRGAARPRHIGGTEPSGMNHERGPVSGERGYENSRSQETPKKKHPIRTLFLVLLLAALAGAGWLGFKMFAGGAGNTAQAGYYTVAVFGLDSRNGNVSKEALSDVNVIARFDMESGEIRLVSLYRDTYSQISSDGSFHKLNEAYFKGGPEQAVWAVEHNTDVKVDDYAAFNWKAIVDAINILGGIDLEITDAEFKYINAYITETVNSTGVGSVQLEHAGMNHLDGVQAVAYARLRLMDTDFNRTARQRKVVKLAFEKAKAADFLTLNNILVTVMPQISTSVTVDDMLPFARNIHHFYIGETAGFPFEREMADVGKLDCVIPVTLESNARALHAFLYPDKAYEPSAMLKEISDRIINDTGFGGSGSTEIRTDAPAAGGGQSSGGEQASETEAPAPEESTVPEESSEAETEETESTQETAETDENGEPVTEEPESESTEPESTGEDVVVSPAINGAAPELIEGPGNSGYVTSDGSGTSIDDAVVVSPAGGGSVSGSMAGPGGNSSASVPTMADGPGGSSGNAGTVYGADSPGAVSEGPGFTEAVQAPDENEADTDGNDAGAGEETEAE